MAHSVRHKITQARERSLDEKRRSISTDLNIATTGFPPSATRSPSLDEPEYPSGVHQTPEQREKGWFSPP